MRKALSDVDRAPAPITRASRSAIAHYRAEAVKARATAAAWDTLADELAAFRDASDEHEGQGVLL